MKQMGKNGFTLIELLVALAISSIVGVVIVTAYQAQVREKNTEEALTDMNQSARAAFEIMTNEIRMAGLNPTENANARIFVANVGELVFSLDRRDNLGTNAPNGNCCDPNEQIRYHLTNDANNDGVNDNIAGGVSCDLGRETGSGLIPALGCGGGTGGLQTLAKNVDVLNFVYLDGAGVPIPPATLTAQAGRDTIRFIQVTLVARAGIESQGFMYEFTDKAIYSNLQGTVILPAQNDHFRRLRLATTINCRNLGQ